VEQVSSRSSQAGCFESVEKQSAICVSRPDDKHICGGTCLLNILQEGTCLLDYPHKESTTNIDAFDPARGRGKL
jgi:hypothetical protein